MGLKLNLGQSVYARIWFFFLGFFKYSCILQNTKFCNTFSQKETSTANIIATSSHFENALIFDFSGHSFFISPVGKKLDFKKQ